jgi:hypothetical protein
VSPKKIAILVHENEDFAPDYGYTLRLLATEWQRLGFQVDVIRGPEYDGDADCAILHIDLTQIPAAYLEKLTRYPIVINKAAHDISKQLVGARHLVRRGDGYQGQVIVKTNENFGGVTERRIGVRPGLLERLRRSRRLPWSWNARLSPYDYPIFESPRQVPLAVWFNPRLVVQRFLCERRDEYYCLRQWFFFGAREGNTISFSHHPIVKGHRVVRREHLPGVPDELRAMRQRLGFDYGRFDYGVVDGEVILYDANRTPTSAPTPHPVIA